LLSVKLIAKISQYHSFQLFNKGRKVAENSYPVETARNFPIFELFFKWNFLLLMFFYWRSF